MILLLTTTTAAITTTILTTTTNDDGDEKRGQLHTNMHVASTCTHARTHTHTHAQSVKQWAVNGAPPVLFISSNHACSSEHMNRTLERRRKRREKKYIYIHWACDENTNTKVCGRRARKKKRFQDNAEVTLHTGARHQKKYMSITQCGKEQQVT